MALDTIDCFMFPLSDIGGDGENCMAELFWDDNSIPVVNVNGDWPVLVLLYPLIPNDPEGARYETPVPGGVFVDTQNRLVVVNGQNIIVDVLGTPTEMCFFWILYDSDKMSGKVNTIKTNYDSTPCGLHVCKLLCNIVRLMSTPVWFQQWFLGQTSGNAAQIAYVNRVEADGGVVEAIGCVPSGVWDWTAPVGPAYGPEVTAWIAELATQGFASPSAANLSLLDTFVSALKSAGVWTGLDIVEVWAQDSGSANAGRVNLVSPSDTLATLYNAVAFTDKVGIQGDGVSAYVDTGFTPSTYGGGYSDNDAFIGAYVFSQSTVTAHEFISNSGANGALRIRNSNSVVQRINCVSNNLTTAVGFGTTGFLGIHKTSNLNVIAQVDSTTSSHSYGFDSTTTPDGNIVLFAQTGLAAFVDAGISIFMAGSEQSANASALNTAVSNYLTAVAAL